MHPNLATYYEGFNITKKQARVLTEHMTLLNDLVEGEGFGDNYSETLDHDILKYLIDNRAIVPSESPTEQITSLFSDEEQGAIIPKYAPYGINNTVSTNNDPINFNNEQTSIEILSSDNGILTDDEVSTLRKATTTT